MCSGTSTGPFWIAFLTSWTGSIASSRPVTDRPALHALMLTSPDHSGISHEAIRGGCTFPTVFLDVEGCQPRGGACGVLGNRIGFHLDQRVGAPSASPWALQAAAHHASWGFGPSSTEITTICVLNNAPRWSHPRGNQMVPSPWRATRVLLFRRGQLDQRCTGGWSLHLHRIPGTLRERIRGAEHARNRTSGSVRTRV